MLNNQWNRTHTHTHTYIYIYRSFIIYLSVSFNNWTLFGPRKKPISSNNVNIESSAGYTSCSQEWNIHNKMKKKNINNRPMVNGSNTGSWWKVFTGKTKAQAQSSWHLLYQLKNNAAHCKCRYFQRELGIQRWLLSICKQLQNRAYLFIFFDIKWICLIKCTLRACVWVVVVNMCLYNSAHIRILVGN